MLAFPSAPSTRVAPATRPLRARKSHPSSSDCKTQLNWLSSKSSARASGAWRHSHPQVTIFYLGFLFWHLWMTHPPCVRINTCAQVCTYLTHVLSQKVLSLTKPKGKIYKTKSLGHYITNQAKLIKWLLYNKWNKQLYIAGFVLN